MTTPPTPRQPDSPYQQGSAYPGTHQHDPLGQPGGAPYAAQQQAAPGQDPLSGQGYASQGHATPQQGVYPQAPYGSGASEGYAPQPGHGGGQGAYQGQQGGYDARPGQSAAYGTQAGHPGDHGQGWPGHAAQQDGYGAQPGYGAQTGQSAYGGQADQAGHGTQAGQGGYGAQPGYGAQAGQSAYGGQADQGGHGVQAGYGGQAGQAEYGGRSGQGGYGGSPGQVAVGYPPQTQDPSQQAQGQGYPQPPDPYQQAQDPYRQGHPQGGAVPDPYQQHYGQGRQPAQDPYAPQGGQGQQQAQDPYAQRPQGQDPYAQQGGGGQWQPTEPAAPAKKKVTGKLLGALGAVGIFVVIAAVKFGAGFVLGEGVGAVGDQVTGAPRIADVGDCMAGQNENSLKVVDCKDAGVEWKVSQKVEGKTEAQFDADKEFTMCRDKKVTSAYWEGERGGAGWVLCLIPAGKKG
ncbi:hypothetical protein Sme01_32570 [Sphaerisporangium melleum]|uniref:Uncharacterized protein n=1 Tax=Sphaerisporangium melleum TaxID=321316 RepID=A0A917RIV5_9ACTN|nr:hypothetical protein [Sphaerisporangium melleum]GGL10085.1 hypothetical protein GCM10007964_60320 [Sphaerisporangium melleum]GII70781.1 hypothetical protein Sme01_32570 [Sphaerisporangium melleum]